MYEQLIEIVKKRPKAYEPSDAAFWDDEHISKYMLKAHLAEGIDSASRKKETIDKSVKWIGSLPIPIKNVLDLGCGPGLYAEKFDDLGFQVTGLDMSKRSIQYAMDSAKKKKRFIKYRYQDYLGMNYKEEFDVVTLIYCDYGVLPEDDRKVLLKKAYNALRTGGIMILDAFTENHYSEFREESSFNYEKSGFWRAKPYICMQRNLKYENNDYLEQYFILTDKQLTKYNIWNHGFTKAELLNDFRRAGFDNIEFFGDVTGSAYGEDGETICILGKKIL